MTLLLDVLICGDLDVYFFCCAFIIADAQDPSVPDDEKEQKPKKGGAFCSGEHEKAH